MESLAKNLQVPYYSMAIDCMSFATENRLSVQEAARQIRYDFFESILAMYGYKSVLTAHHAADNLETMLYTFLKGASLNALRGIPIERGYITRPMLYTEKSVIDAYIRRAKLTYRHDVSNDSVKYKRNYIRHEIIPRLEEINPSIESTLINTAQLGASYQALIDSIIAKSKVEFLRTKKLDLRSCTLPAAQHAWLY